MLLIVASALLGAYLGMNSRNQLLAALVTSALAGAAYVILDFLGAFASAYAVSPHKVWLFFRALGMGEGGLLRTMGAGASAAIISGLLLAFLEPRPARRGVYMPGEDDARPKRRPWFRRDSGARPARTTEALNRIDEVLNS